MEENASQLFWDSCLGDTGEGRKDLTEELFQKTLKMYAEGSLGMNMRYIVFCFCGGTHATDAEGWMSCPVYGLFKVSPSKEVTLDG